ncbi:MAG TPA: pentapeptide repeat-containing protein [Candidatus Acidoferrales bacterium]|nr:pentapeptide repeat-containing protein [Candidatus Acidoferrales bacterium]
MPSLFHRLLQSEDVEERAAIAADPPPPAPAGTANEMINAEDLPSAAAKLAELFPEAPPAESAEVHAEAKPEDKPTTAVVAVAPAEAPPEPSLAPKRRGIFSWLFGSKDSPKAIEEISLVAEWASTPPASNEAALARHAETPVTPKTVQGSVAPAAETTADPIPAEQLPPAGELLAVLFTQDQRPNAAETIVSTSEPVDEPAAVPVAQIEQPAETASPESSESVEPPPPESPQVEEPVLQDFDDAPPSSLSADFLGAMKSAMPRAEPHPVEAASMDDSDATQRQGPAAPEPLAYSQPSAQLAEPKRPAYRDWALDDKLAGHREWVESHGLAGTRADLSCAELEGADLISVNLRMADLHDANLRAADMLLADLRDACLVRADLEESCLVGANLEGANLEGASLETAMGLVPRQLAGANLRDALLAPQLMEFEAESKFAHNSRKAHRYFGAMTVTSVLSWLLLWKTKDAQIVSDSALLPFLHSHAAAAALPTAESYLIVPGALFLLYLLFHFHLQRLWESVEELPAIFPDGHPLGDEEPALILGLLRTHFRWMNPDPSSTRIVERGISVMLAYGIVPVTLLLFWSRYLTRQEVHGTILHTILAVVSSGVSIHAITKVGRRPERWEFERTWVRRLVARIKAVSPVTVAAAFGFVLLLIAAGTLLGVPHDRARAPQYGSANIRRWAPTLFWWTGFDPYPDLTEASLSSRPPTWNVDDDRVSSVDGARLNDVHLRYAQAYGVFLANAHMLQANLQGAFLSQADFRGADLGQSDLRYAVLDQARMYRVNLDRSNLDGADLRRADLRAANLSHSSLHDSILEDARLEGASLYTSRLDGAILIRTNLEKTDLRDAYMAGTHMDHADLRNAYLWSATLTNADLGGAQLDGAILIDADLRGANLGGTQFAGTVLNNANLSGTSLEGANMRGAFGLTAAQICSAKSRRGVMLDDALQTQVEAECGGTR